MSATAGPLNACNETDPEARTAGRIYRDCHNYVDIRLFIGIVRRRVGLERLSVAGSAKAMAFPQKRAEAHGQRTQKVGLDSLPGPSDDPGKAPAVSAHPLGQDDRLATSERPAGAPKTRPREPDGAPLAKAGRALLVHGLMHDKG